MDNVLGTRFKQLLTERGYTQTVLSQKTGISRQYISCLCRGERHNISYQKLSKLAEALYVSTEELLAVLNGIEKLPNKRISFEEQLELIKLIAPVFIPVYDSSHFYTKKGKNICPVDIIPIQREYASNKHLEAYRVHENYLPPMITENDIILTDFNARINTGTYVACQHDDQFIIGKIGQSDDKPLIESEEGCLLTQECSKVVRVIRIIRDV